MQMTGRRIAARLGVGAVWGLVMFGLVWGLPLAGALLIEPSDVTAVRVAGPLIGFGLAVLVCRRARQWIQKLRRRAMGADAVTATATVRRVDVYRTRGRTIYTVWFAWTDPGGAAQLRERQFGFFAGGLRAFEVRVADGAEATVRYAAGRPERFVVDIAYAPTMADQFL